MLENCTTILKTKLSAPKVANNLVIRPRLTEQLTRGTGQKLTLISAPAGFGKTTLVADWLHKSNIETIWLSLDKTDNDSVRFLEYFVSSLQQIKPDFGIAALDTMFSPHPPQMEHIVTILINELDDFPNDIVIVLDDYHIVKSQEIHDILIFLLDHMPEQFHIFITSREDPPFPLSRLRVRAQLTEIRIEDLKFTIKEMEQYFINTMGLRLSKENVSALFNQTEGWVASLQMVGLSLKGKSDINNYIRKISTYNSHIFEYLEEEVFSLQPLQVQEFLLYTSILKGMNPSLCNAITKKNDGYDMLIQLNRANLFIFPFDNHQKWYRYHQLFADLLKFRLNMTKPDIIPELHVNASKWYQKEGLMHEAIYHALKAELYDLAADLLKQYLEHRPEFNMESELARAGELLNRFPKNIIQSRPSLLIYKALILQAQLKFDNVEACLLQAEKLIHDLKKVKTDKQQKPDIDMLNDLLGRIFTIRAWHVYYMEKKIEEPITLSLKALEYLNKKSFSFQIIALLNLSYCYFWSGNVVESETYFYRMITLSQENGSIFFESLGAQGLFFINTIRGKYKAAECILEKILNRYKKKYPNHSRQLAAYSILLISLGFIYHTQNKLDLAAEYLTKGVELAKNHSLPIINALGHIALALVIQAKGDNKSATEMLEQAKQYLPENTQIVKFPALMAKINITGNNFEPVKAWIRENDLDINDKIRVTNELDYVTFAAYLIAKKKYGKAIFLLEKLADSANANKRYGFYIEILILLALSYQQENNETKSLEIINQALILAEPEDFLQVFIDNSSPMLELLTLYKNGKDKSQQLPSSDFVDKLILRIQKKLAEPDNVGHRVTTSDPKNKLPWSYRLDPLSKRELEVLSLMALTSTNPEIADQLCISLNTVKTHIKRIHSKLHVNCRKKAVLQAKAIGLIQ